MKIVVLQFYENCTSAQLYEFQASEIDSPAPAYNRLENVPSTYFEKDLTGLTESKVTMKPLILISFFILKTIEGKCLIVLSILIL